MDFKSLLNQVLSLLGQGSSSHSQHSRRKSGLGTLGKGMAGAGVAALLLKKKHRKTLMKAGSYAALGGLAYYAYRTWQQNRNSNTGAAAATTPVPALPQSAFEAEGAAAEEAGRIILLTMLAAAAADGEIDQAERALILQEAGDDAETAQWLLQQSHNAPTVAELAAEIGSNTALAAEAYLAARMVCGELSRKEIVFLAQLSQALNLDDKLVEALEQQAVR